MNTKGLIVCLALLAVTCGAVRQSVNTLWGTYTAQDYVAFSSNDKAGALKWGAKSGDTGATITISFAPNAKVNCEKIGLIQMVLESIKAGTNYDRGCLNLSPTAGQNQKLKCARSDGVGHLDRTPEAKNPVYGAEHTLPGKKALLSKAPAQPVEFTAIADTPVQCSNSAFKRSMPNAPGCHYQLGKKVGSATTPAKLLDTPTLGTTPKAGDKYRFEAAAMCLKGAQVGQIYGSVKWGFTVNSSLQSVVDAFGVAARTGAAQQFMSLLQKWNSIQGVIKTPTPKVQAPGF